jgi:branched-chain amino acid transport system substrate-binding protein
MIKKALFCGLILSVFLFAGCVQQEVKEETHATAVDKAVILSKAVDGINGIFNRYDSILSTSARELSGKDYSSQDARDILTDALNKTPYAIEYAIVDAGDILVTIEPEQYKSSEGANISDQQHVKKLKATGKPVMSGIFTTVEGFDAAAIHYPIYSEDKNLSGELSLLIMPQTVIGETTKPMVEGAGLELWAMDVDGKILYDADTVEIGKNLFTDPAYQSYPELLSLGKSISNQKAGTGEYSFLRQGENVKVTKQAQWDTVELYGAEWRIVITRESSI